MEAICPPAPIRFTLLECLQVGPSAQHFDEAALNRMNERATPEIMRKRRYAAELPSPFIKRMTAGGRFLTRNLKSTDRNGPLDPRL